MVVSPLGEMDGRCHAYVEYDTASGAEASGSRKGLDAFCLFLPPSFCVFFRGPSVSLFPTASKQSTKKKVLCIFFHVPSLLSFFTRTAAQCRKGRASSCLTWIMIALG